MYVVHFPTYRVVEYSSPLLFQSQVGKWMEIREAENSYLLGQLPAIVSRAQQTGTKNERLFALQDRDTIVAAGILYANGSFCHTWATREMIDSFVDELADSRCLMTTVFGPAHVSWQFAKAWADRVNQRWDIERGERVYQLARVTHALPATGRLEPAAERDVPQLLPWFQGFMAEADYEDKSNPRAGLEDLIRARNLFLWKSPAPVAMAAWTAPTAHGGSINFVYTPPEFRGRGFAKAVVSALAQSMLDRGRSYCFILTDVNDERLHRLYTGIGARTLCELARCKLIPGRALPIQSSQDAPVFSYNS